MKTARRREDFTTAGRWAATTDNLINKMRLKIPPIRYELKKKSKVFINNPAYATPIRQTRSTVVSQYSFFILRSFRLYYWC